MRLYELFQDDGGMSLTDELRNATINILTPLLAHDVPFVTVQSVIDALRSTKPGIAVDKGLVMTLLDPDKVKTVSEIDGDRIYLKEPSNEDGNEQQDKKASQIQQVKDKAIKQANQDVRK